jgi:hypothetical protein
MVNICVSAAGITRDGLAVKVDKDANKVVVYPLEVFRQVLEVNLIAPVYWAMEMLAGIAEERRRQGLKRREPHEPSQGAGACEGHYFFSTGFPAFSQAR